MYCVMCATAVQKICTHTSVDAQFYIYFYICFYEYFFFLITHLAVSS